MWRAWARRPRWGPIAAAVCCLSLAAGTAFGLPPFFGGDEASHFAYVIYVVEGDLPEIGDPVPSGDGRFPIMAERVESERAPRRREDAWLHVANHPPLFYLLAAGPVRLAAYSSSPALPPLMVRLVNATFMAIGVVLAGKLAGELFPRWRGTPLVAAGLTAVTPGVVGVAALGQNDGLAFALAAGALLVMVRLLRRGPETGLVVAAAGLAAGCALTRAGLAVAAGGLVLATLVGAVRRSPRPLVDLIRLRPWWPAWSWVVVAAAPTAAAGWFYLRNKDLYGSFTADGYLLDFYHRQPAGSRLDVLRSAGFHDTMWRGLYGSVHPLLVYSGAGWVLGALVAVTCAGLVAEVNRRRHRAQTSAPAPATNGAGPGIGAAGWLLLGGYTAALYVGVADFVSKGGSSHPRYFLPLVPLASALVAAAIGALPLRRVLASIALVGLLAVTTSQLLGYSDLIDERDAQGRLWNDDPSAGPLAQQLAGFVAIVAFVAVAAQLAAIGRAPDDDAARASSPQRLLPTTPVERALSNAQR